MQSAENKYSKNKNYTANIEVNIQNDGLGIVKRKQRPKTVYTH